MVTKKAKNRGYTFEPYDVIQVTRDGGQTWEDYSTLRDESEGRVAVNEVVMTRTLPIRYRITRGQRPIFGA